MKNKTAPYIRFVVGGNLLCAAQTPRHFNENQLTEAVNYAKGNGVGFVLDLFNPRRPISVN